jgi:biopolymer transport protein ExbD
MIKRLAFIVLILLLGCRDSQTVPPPSKETSAVHSSDKDVAKIIVTREGVIYLDGQQVTLDKLDADIGRRGTTLRECWYHREHPEDENPYENAMKVVGIIAKHRRPVAMYLDRNFTTRAKLN